MAEATGGGANPPEGYGGCSTMGGADRDTLVTQRFTLSNAGFWCSEIESVEGSSYAYQFFCCSKNQTGGGN